MCVWEDPNFRKKQLTGNFMESHFPQIGGKYFTCEIFSFIICATIDQNTKMLRPNNWGLNVCFLGFRALGLCLTQYHSSAPIYLVCLRKLVCEFLFWYCFYCFFLHWSTLLHFWLGKNLQVNSSLLSFFWTEALSYICAVFFVVELVCTRHGHGGTLVCVSFSL